MKKKSKSRVVRGKEEICESKLEVDLRDFWEKYYTEPIVPQLRFHPEKKWRFDFAFPSAWLAVEIQGFGTGHTSYEGMHRDYEKHNAAMSLGWGIVYLMSYDLKRAHINKTCQYILKVLTARQNNEPLMRGVKELGHTTVHPNSREGFDNINEARGRMLERFNQHKLSSRDDEIR